MKFRKPQKKDKIELLELFKQLTNKKINLNINVLIRNKNCNCLVIEHNKKIIGFGSLCTYLAPTSGYIGVIEDIIVDENFRGQKLGKKLMEKLIETGKKKGVKKINLTSNPSRIAARKLYLSLGFKLRDTGVFRLKL